MTYKYQVLYADPPWNYRGRKQFGFAGEVGVDTGGSIMHYKTMSVDELCELNIGKISAVPSILFIWVPNPLLLDGMRVIDAWGYRYATVGFVWDKQRTNPGYYTLSQCELCLVAKRHLIPTPRGSRNERQFISALRGKHSAKPAEVRDRIFRMFPLLRKIELFAREKVDGWDAWGDEIESDVEL